ncbi:MAG: putative LPS assembly protein LptD [Bacteroidota bacterium]
MNCNFHGTIRKARFFFFALLFSFPPLFSQTNVSDSVTATRADSSHADSLQKKVENDSGIDTLVTYWAMDSITFNLRENSMQMYRKGGVRYRQIELNADSIIVQLDSSNVHAFGGEKKDTATQPQSKQGERRKLNPGDKAKLIDGGEEYFGKQLAYNFKSKRGRIVLAETQIDNGYYYGNKIKRISPEIMFVADGQYTTCDKDTPHYYFFSPKMKLVPRNRIVAEPIYLYIADAPVFALPFGVFPNRGGRRSGLIAPAYGEDARFGRYLSHLGYYWAMNDYMDFAATGDIYTRGSFALNANYNYALLYNFGGNLHGTYRRYRYNERADKDFRVDEAYNIGILHRQTINPTSKLDVNFRFASNNSYVFTNNLNDALQQSIESNASYSKRWEGSPNSFSASITRSQNLRDGSITELLPGIFFNRSLTFPLRGKGASSEYAWYENLGYNYNISASNGHRKSAQKIDGVKFFENSDTIFRTADVFQQNYSQSISQGLGFSFSPPKLGYFSLVPSLSLRESRSFSTTIQPIRSYRDSSLADTTLRQQSIAGYLQDGVSLNTKLYGIIQPNALGIAALRHTFSPSLSLSHAKQIYGERAGKASMTLGFNVGNNFEMKTLTSDTTEKENKIQLMNINGGVGYNFMLDSMNFSPVNISYHTSIGDLLSIGGSSTYNLYQYDYTSRKRINRFLLSKEKRFADVTNISLSLQTSLSGEKIKRLIETEQDTAQQGILPNTNSVSAGNMPDFTIPWQISLGWNFSQSQKQEGNPAIFRNSSMNGSVSFNLTQNWKFDMSATYDLIQKELAAPSVSISRNLHCWIMNFSWTPIGEYRQWRLEIRINDSTLQDVKVTKSRNPRGIY